MAKKPIDPKDINWRKYRLRTCYTMHLCELCMKTIFNGERYFDGGYRRRAHEECVKGLEK